MGFLVKFNEQKLTNVPQLGYTRKNDEGEYKSEFFLASL